MSITDQNQYMQQFQYLQEQICVPEKLSLHVQSPAILMNDKIKPERPNKDFPKAVDVLYFSLGLTNYSAHHAVGSNAYTGTVAVNTSCFILYGNDTKILPTIQTLLVKNTPLGALTLAKLHNVEGASKISETFVFSEAVLKSYSYFFKDGISFLIVFFDSNGLQVKATPTTDQQKEKGNLASDFSVAKGAK